MRHRVPEWYRNAKLGIMVHWGVPTIPAYAPVENGGISEILRDHDWEFYFRNNPYAEWYLNSIRIEDSPARAYHRKHFGAQTPYERLAKRFNEEVVKWDPRLWADLFREAGARYVVFVAKHHDGYLMWPSNHRPPSDAFVAPRDVVGELGEAVRAEGLKYGLYYSGLIDWTVQRGAIRDFADLMLAETPPDYEAYALAHFRELIERYRPDVLWNDIGLPAGIPRRKLFSAYREAVPEGVLNDRWRQIQGSARALLSGPGRRWISRFAQKSIVRGDASGGAGDVATMEYPPRTSLRSQPWELVRGLGRSFAYNAAEPDDAYLSATALVHLLADVVAKNGNLLLNVAPRADGSIPAPQLTALTGLAAWLRDHAPAIFGTRPWHVAEGTTADGLPVRFTTRDGSLYAIVLGRPTMLALTFPGLDLRKVPRPQGRRDDLRLRAHLLGTERPIEWHAEDGKVIVDIPGSAVQSDATVVEFRWHAQGEDQPSAFYTDLI